jgi:hypothetical protein
VGEWLRVTAGARLELRAQRLREIECTPLHPTPSMGFTAVQEAATRPPALVIGPDEATRSDVLEISQFVEAARPARPSTPSLAQAPAPQPRRPLGLLGALALALAGLSLAFALSQWAPEPAPAAAVTPRATREATTDEDLHVVVGPAVAMPSAEPPRVAPAPAPAPERSKLVSTPAKKRAALRLARNHRANSKISAKPAPARPKPEPPRRAEDLFSRN